MIIVLCEDYGEARNAYLAWLSFLQSSPSDIVVLADRYSLRVETIDGLRCIFVDYRFADIFLGKDALQISVENFFGITGTDDPDPLRKEWRQIVSY